MLLSPRKEVLSVLSSNLAVFSARRAEHSRTGWAMTAVEALYQPQDGATPVRSRIAELGSRVRRMAGEPDDARMTGATRSLGRRLSGLNLNLVRPKSPAVVKRVALPVLNAA